MNQPFAIVRVFGCLPPFSSKADPTSRFCKEERAWIMPDGRAKEYEHFLNLGRGDKPTPPGDYEVVPKSFYVSRDRTRAGVDYELVPLKSASKAA